MKTIVGRIKEAKIVPVIKIEDSRQAEPLAEALIAGGLPVAEITFRTDAAVNAIKEMKKFPEMLVGAGTITTVKQATQAIEAGAEFLVTAGFNKAVVEYAIEKDISIFPGACTPSELMNILEYDIPVAKFFPAEQFGGLKTIKSLSGPFPNILFMPTGGITLENIVEYLAFPKIIACGGSWMVKDELINEGRFDEITKFVSEVVILVNQQNEFTQEVS